MDATDNFSFWSFLSLGVRHILTGYDHLVFLVGLLIICTRVRSVVVIVTAFTVAHSLTLILSTLDVIRLPGVLVEPLIAATIVAVGIENLVTDEFGWRRRALAFLFGLIHGLGFAGVLREIGVGKNGQQIALPLFGFNLGVECGQLLVASLVLPLILWLSRNGARRPHWRKIASLIVSGLGFYWFAERIFFLFG